MTRQKYISAIRRQNGKGGTTENKVKAAKASWSQEAIKKRVAKLLAKLPQ